MTLLHQTYLDLFDIENSSSEMIIYHHFHYFFFIAYEKISGEDVIVFDSFFFFFQAEDGIRDADVTGVQTCALPISTEAANDSLQNLPRVSETLLDRYGEIRTPGSQVTSSKYLVDRPYQSKPQEFGLADRKSVV